MAYKVIKDFTDIATGKEYKEGDVYDEVVTASKLDFMLNPTKHRGPLIAVDGDEPKEEEPEEEELTSEGEEELGV